MEAFRGMEGASQMSPEFGCIAACWGLWCAIKDAIALASPDVMKARIRVSAAEKGRDGWRRAIFSRWKNALWVIWLTSGSSEAAGSNIAARLQMWGEVCALGGFGEGFGVRLWQRGWLGSTRTDWAFFKILTLCKMSKVIQGCACTFAAHFHSTPQCVYFWGWLIPDDKRRMWGQIQ